MEEVGAIWCDWRWKKTSLSRLATKKMDGHDEFLFVSVHDDVLDLDAWDRHITHHMLLLAWAESVTIAITVNGFPFSGYFAP